MYCRNCGEFNTEGTRFCVKCGTPFVLPESEIVNETVSSENIGAGEAINEQVSVYTEPEPMYVEPVAPEYVAPAPTAPVATANSYEAYDVRNITSPSAPKKSKGSALAAIFVLIAVLLAGTGIFYVVKGLLDGKDDGERRHKDYVEATNTPVPTKAEAKPTKADPAPTEVVKDEKAYRTIMIYMIGSNLESNNGLGSQDIDEILAANPDENVKIVLQTGGTKRWYKNEIKDGQVQRFEITNRKLVELDNLGKVSMVETDTLTDFIRFAAAKYPAKEYTLVLWDHGGSIPVGFGSDEIFTQEILSDVEIGKAVKDGGVHFSSLIFNACEMCSLELFMSLKDSVDYVVAAESSVYGYTNFGSGIYYTNWVNMASRTDVTTQMYCEQILDDYIEFLAEIKSKGSMSVIRMDRIQEVYDAYVDYIAAAYSDLTGSGYETYMAAREKSGAYETTDAVDISTLASNYENDYSTALINAVSNAIVRTKSDISCCHGITAYSPYKLAYLYNEGRSSFMTLDYDSKIVGFYDLLASKILYYDGQTQYAGNWYVKQNDNTQSGDTKKLEYVLKDGRYVLALSENDWKKVQQVKICYNMVTETQTYCYGWDVRYTVDSNRYIVATAPSKWLLVNNYFPTSLCQQYVSDDNGWYKINFVYAYVNGEESFVQVYTDNNGNCTIQGYYAADFDEMTYYSDTYNTFTSADRVKWVAKVIRNGEEKFLETEEFAGDALTSSYAEIEQKEDARYTVSHEIKDFYGNTYYTDEIYID